MLHPFLEHHAGFYKENGVYFQRDLIRNNAFENAYLTLRQQEGRLYPDDVLRLLPTYRGHIALEKEWNIRKNSADNIIAYLKRKKVRSIVELGCGNGWLLNYINKTMHVNCLGIDINETELEQATRTGSEGCHFAYADIFDSCFDKLEADIIVLASCLQYFEDAQRLLGRLNHLLGSQGEIHILDTPFYERAELSAATSRSRKYFNDQGVTSMEKFYYHHDASVYKGMKHEIMYDPRLLISRIQQKLMHRSPFFWIKIFKT
jgi:ubiquinone/menaquinone biosynthesis C-methylase UbiE